MFIKFNSLARRLAAYNANAKGFMRHGIGMHCIYVDVCVDFKGTKSVLDLPKKPQTAETKGVAAAAFALPRNQPLGIYPKNRQYQKVMYFQQLYCMHDGVLVWQISPVDEWSFYITRFVIVVLFAWAVYRMYVISVPKKKKD